ncbi:MAG TPA: META domain-containing protein [Thermoanaerobaculia bacterium]|nr:META domain-containing protein [Thermoanaerobaculia bacterium]
MKKMHSLLTFVAVAFFSACTNAGAASDLPEIRDKQWTLVALVGESSVPTGEQAPWVRFGSDDKLSANTGCNSASGDYTLSGDQLKVGMLISTKRACVDRDRNEVEGQFMGALSAARRVRVVNGELELLGDDGRFVARFRSS